ncbi:hypothetical protein [Actinoplanes sp. NPDC051851]|uniref:hypothetical protein n=1 Tax=Actinoplanes sp. NPDC051851 TaxID=3154753 RepID=UPI003436B93C
MRQESRIGTHAGSQPEDGLAPDPIRKPFVALFRMLPGGRRLPFQGGIRRPGGANRQIHRRAEQFLPMLRRIGRAQARVAAIAIEIDGGRRHAPHLSCRKPARPTAAPMIVSGRITTLSSRVRIPG